MQNIFSEAEQARIAEAVQQAEGRTSGEIVPFIMPRSDRYHAAVWRGASLAAVIVLGLAMATKQFHDGWGLAWLYDSRSIALMALLAGSLGAALSAWVPAIKRRLVGESQLTRMVHLQAMRAFTEEEVFDTRDRTGILLFISLFEHRIEVLGDTGINAKVSADDWTDVVDRIRKGIQQGNLANGLIDAIDRCGELLERKGVEIRPDDTNELSDKVRFRSED